MSVVYWYKVVILVLYMMVLMLTSVWVSPMVVWVGLELCMLFTLLVLYIEKVSMESQFLYYLIQAVSSLMMVMSMVIVVKLGFILGVVVKFGLIPYFWWVVEVLKDVKMGMGLFLVLGLQKFLPLMLFSRWFIMNSGDLVYIISILGVFSMLIGLLMMMSFYGFIWVLAGSSMVHSSWLLIFSMLSPSILGVYLGVYLVFMFLIIWGGVGGILSLWGWVLMLLSSVPPLAGFVLKLYGIFSMNLEFVLLIFSILTVSALSSVVYLRGMMLSSMMDNFDGLKSRGYSGDLILVLMVILVCSILMFM